MSGKYMSLSELNEPPSESVETQIASDLTPAQYLLSKQLTGPALLFLASHRTLAFPAAQLLRTVEPLARILDVEACHHIADWLDNPAALEEFEERLTRRGVEHPSES